MTPSRDRFGRRRRRVARRHARRATQLRRDGFDGRITVIDGESRTALRQAAAVQAGAQGRLGARPHRAARGQARTSTSTGAWASTPLGLDLADRFVRARRRRPGRLRRPGPRHRRRGPAPARHRPDGRRVRAAHARRLPRPARRARRRHRRGWWSSAPASSGARWRPPAASAGSRSPSSRWPPVPLERALGAEMGMVCAGLHRDHGVDLRLGVGVDGLDRHRPRRGGAAGRRRGDRRRGRRGRHRRRAHDRVDRRIGAHHRQRRGRRRDARGRARRRGRRRHRPVPEPPVRRAPADRALGERRPDGSRRGPSAPGRRPGRGRGLRPGAVVLVRPVRPQDPARRPLGRPTTGSRSCTGRPRSGASSRSTAATAGSSACSA